MSLRYILVKVDTDMDSYDLASILRRRARLKRGLDPALFDRLRKMEAETKAMMHKRGD